MTRVVSSKKSAKIGDVAHDCVDVYWIPLGAGAAASSNDDGTLEPAWSLDAPTLVPLKTLDGPAAVARAFDPTVRLVPLSGGSVPGVGRHEAREALIVQQQTIVGPLMKDRATNLVAARK